eukprot:SAG11_NODE_1644_length_4526_cov_1.563813_3_plen_152_part_00
MIASEGPSPTGIRTFFYNCTVLNAQDHAWLENIEVTKLDLPQFWDNYVHSPTGNATGPACHGGNNTILTPMADSVAIERSAAILAPYPKAIAISTCPLASKPTQQHYGGAGLIYALPTQTYSECEAACCAEDGWLRAVGLRQRPQAVCPCA